MCGRFSLIAEIGELAARFDFDADGLARPPRYNIAPTQPALAVTGGERRGASFMRWGLIPAGIRNASAGGPMINARAETVAERPSFRAALRRRRCLVLADGFYEWRRNSAGKQPVRFALASGGPFAFAGLWDTWRGPTGESVSSCTIITTEANELLRPIHDRMPVILPRDLEPLWLDHEMQDTAVLGGLLTPYRAAAMEAYEVCTLVNSVVNDGPELLRPLQQAKLI